MYKKILFVFFILTFFYQDFSQAEKVKSRLVEAIDPAGNVYQTTITKVFYDGVRPLSQNGAARNCYNFIKKKDELNYLAPNTWGQEILIGVYRDDTNASDCINNQADFSQICPKFKKFTRMEKNLFFIYLMGFTAHTESSCDPSAQAGGVNDIADGLLQLEYTATQRNDANRHERLCSTNRGVDTQNIRFQALCSVQIFKQCYCNASVKRVVGLGAKNACYWSELNGKSRKVFQHIKKHFKPCFNY